MSKSVIVMDTPKNCGECDLVCDDCSGLYCIPSDRYFDGEDGMAERPDWCPIRELPEKRNRKKLSLSPLLEGNQYSEYSKGWNACLDAITGEAQQ